MFRIMYQNCSLRTNDHWTSKQRYPLRRRRLLGVEVTQLIPGPTGIFHHKLIKDHDAAAAAARKQGSCRSGSTVLLQTATNAALPVKLKITPQLVRARACCAALQAGFQAALQTSLHPRWVATCLLAVQLVHGRAPNQSIRSNETAYDTEIVANTLCDMPRLS